MPKVAAWHCTRNASAQNKLGARCKNGEFGSRKKEITNPPVDEVGSLQLPRDSAGIFVGTLSKVNGSAFRRSAPFTGGFGDDHSCRLSPVRALWVRSDERVAVW
jgi:hypothetical protein